MFLFLHFHYQSSEKIKWTLHFKFIAEVVEAEFDDKSGLFSVLLDIYFLDIVKSVIIFESGGDEGVIVYFDLLNECLKEMADNMMEFILNVLLYFELWQFLYEIQPKLESGVTEFKVFALQYFKH